jgi:hypothetical protein
MEFGKNDLKALVKNRKLVLLVDLDHTLIHTTYDPVSNDLPVKCVTCELLKPVVYLSLVILGRPSL